MKSPSVEEEVTLTDEAPSALRRPLTLINGQAYAATWLLVRVKAGTPPKLKTERRLFILRRDGRLFDDKGKLFSGEHSKELGLSKREKGQIFILYF